MARVRVKYCGHCNPEGDGLELVKEIARLAPDLEFFSWGIEDGVALLIYSACPVGCVTMPGFAGPVLHVVCNTVNGIKWSPEELPLAVLRGLRELSGLTSEPAELPADRCTPRLSGCAR